MYIVRKHHSYAAQTTISLWVYQASFHELIYYLDIRFKNDKRIHFDNLP
jgi:hypothetical protein